MTRFCFITFLLLLSAVSTGAPAQSGEQAEATQQSTAKAPPAKRPRIPKDILFESSLGDVHFPHRVHMKSGCQGCHHQIHAKDLVTPHAAYLTYSWVNCQDCHSEDNGNSDYYGCAKCHHTNLENIADETLSAKVVVHKSCWKCHLSGTGAEASARCSYCHEQDAEETLSATAEDSESEPAPGQPPSEESG
jgi:hypothetical protein